MTSDAMEFRERKKTKVQFDVRKEGCVTRIDGVDDDDKTQKGLTTAEAPEEEFGSRKTVRKHNPCQPSEQERIEHEMTHLFFQSWCEHCIKGRGRGGLSENGRRRTSCHRGASGRLCSALWCRGNRRVSGVADV